MSWKKLFHGLSGSTFGTRQITGYTIVLLWLAGLGLFFVFAMIPNAGLNGFSGTEVDKLGHLLVFAGLSFVPAAFFDSIRYGLLAASCVAPYGFAIEFLQRQVPGRSFCPEDIIANNAGTLIGIALALGWRAVLFKKQARQKPEPGNHPKA